MLRRIVSRSLVESECSAPYGFGSEDLDGYGVLGHIRSRPATADITVVILTARGDEDNEVRVFELGADDFLSKPFRARALSARLHAVLSRRSRITPQDT